MGLMALPGRSGRSGELGSVDMCWTWKMGRLAARQAASRRAMLRSASGLLRLPRDGSSSPACTSMMIKAVVAVRGVMGEGLLHQVNG